MLKTIIFCLTICVVESSIAQNNILPLFKDTTQSFQNYLETGLDKAFRKDTTIATIETFGFIRFKIDTEGNMVNFECSKEMDLRIKLILQSLVSSNRQGWFSYVENGRKILSDFLIMPIIIARERYPNNKTISATDFLHCFAFETADKPYKDTLVMHAPKNIRFEREIAEPVGRMYLPPVYYYYSTQYRPDNKGRKPIKKAD